MRITIFPTLCAVCVAIGGCGSDSEKSPDQQQLPTEAGVEASAEDANAAADSPQKHDSVDSPQQSGNVGDPCSAADTCPAGGSGTTVCLTEWPGGYCAVADCTQHGHDCPNDPGLGGTATTGGKCVLSPTATCLALCASVADCRDGYACEDRGDSAGHGSAKVCVPKGLGPSDDGGMGDGGMGDGGMGDGAMGDGGMGDGAMGGDDGGMGGDGMMTGDGMM